MPEFQYDPFQQQAIDYINQNESVIVSAPTGAGKTAIAEHVILTCLNTNIGVIYTAPIKALSNQKFRDFQGQFKDSIGILTGDVSINANAPVLIMTTEIFRNKLLDEPDSLNRYSWIIFDEVHYIDNYERGTVWEESLIFLPKHMNILALSATIPNINELSGWMESIHNKPIRTVIENKRPVPLKFLYQCGNEIIDNLNKLKKASRGYKNKLTYLVNYIRKNNGLPCIYFVFSRKRAEYLSAELYNITFLNPQEEKEIASLYDSLIERFDLKHERSSQEMQPLVRRGIAYHHAGMLPTLKEVIERLFTSRLIKIIFTTETFALGINMPSRSVIFDDMRKFYGHFVSNLKTRDFYQMAGRAGRRGMDHEGFVYSRINLNRVRPNEVERIIFGEPEKVRSQLNTSYATILNLYARYQDNLYDIYPQSLHFFQSKKHQKDEALRLLRAKLDLLKNLGYISGKSLTKKGEFAKAVYGNELLLSELYAEGILEDLDEFGLGVLAAAAVFDPRKNQRVVGLSKSARSIRRICEKIYDDIKLKEAKYRIYPASKKPYFHLSPCMEYWLRGTRFDKLLRYTDTDEGEIIRYFRMSIQILKEIDKTAVTSSELKEKLKETIRVINRDIVDAEKQLRES